MPKKSLPTVGTMFKVKVPVEFRVNGQIIARYLPGHDYRVTEVNAEFVAGQLAESNAVETGFTKQTKPGGTVVTK